MARTKKADTRVHRRFHIHPTTDMLLGVMTSLLPAASKRDVAEAALLYGIAYMNQMHKLDVMSWVDEIKLPNIEDVDELLDSYANSSV